MSKKITYINSLCEFVDWINKINENNKGRKVFYRGHSDNRYKLQPGVYRKDVKDYRSNEVKLYQKMLQKNHDSFLNDRTTLERLIRMQHHRLPTRLLDLTSNPLVALFFSCHGKDYEMKKNGEIFSFSLNENDIRFPSDISSLEMLGVDKEFDFPEFINEIIDCMLQYLCWSSMFFLYQNKELDKEGRSWSKPQQRALMNFKHSLLKFRCLLEKYKTKKDHYRRKVNKFTHLNNIHAEIKERCKEINDSYNMIKITFQISNDADDCFLPEIFIGIINESLDNFKRENGFHVDNLDSIGSAMNNIHFIMPPFNNERIKRQQGAFILFPKNEVDIIRECASLFPDSIYSNLSIDSIRIPKDKKINILRELNLIGINNDFLFPSLDNSAEAIKNEY